MPRPDYKLGDLVRCNRCKTLFEQKLCGNCDELHTCEVQTLGACVADHTAEMCGNCMTPGEAFLVEYHEHQRTAHGALPN